MAGIDAYTKLMLHCNGEDESTSFPDSSIYTHIVTAYANAQIDIDEKKFGTGSGLFDGSGDYLSIPDSDDFDFGGGNFTVEWWEYRTASVGASGIISRNYADATSGIYQIGQESESELQVYLSSDGSHWDIANGKSLGTFNLNTWNHFALVRSGNTFYTFKNGQQQSTWSSSLAIADVSTTFEIGRRKQGGLPVYYQGRLDEIRISKGIARWTSNFPVPTEEYSATSIDKSLYCKYNIFNYINENYQFIYLLGTYHINKDIEYLYDLLNLVEKDVLFKYYIGQIINEDYLFKFDVLPILYKKFTFNYDTYNFVDRDLNSKYHIVPKVIKSLQLKYHLGSILDKDIQFNYDTYNFVDRDLNSKYHLGYIVDKDTEFNYKLENYVTKDLNARYYIGHIINKDLQLNYDLYVYVTKDLNSKYDTYNLLKRSFQNFYLIGRLLSKNLEFLYHIGSIISIDNQFIYNLFSALQSLNVDFQYYYNIYTGNILDINHHILTKGLGIDQLLVSKGYNTYIVIPTPTLGGYEEAQWLEYNFPISGDKLYKVFGQKELRGTKLFYINSKFSIASNKSFILLNEVPIQIKVLHDIDSNKILKGKKKFYTLHKLSINGKKSFPIHLELITSGNKKYATELELATLGSKEFKVILDHIIKGKRHFDIDQRELIKGQKEIDEIITTLNLFGE